MVYDKTVWQAREVSTPNKFTKLNENASSVELYAAPGTVTVEGTAFSADNMNNLENGVEAAEVEINQVRGVLDFSANLSGMSPLSQGSKVWSGLGKSGTDMYACVAGDDIYKQTGGVGSFVALGQGSLLWSGITRYGADMYACVRDGDIYKQTNCTGNFVALGLTTKSWYGISSGQDGVYIVEGLGDIYKLVGGAAPLIALEQVSRSWSDIVAFGDDMIACASSDGVYRRTGLTGPFVSVGLETTACHGIGVLDGDIYISTSSDIYRQENGVGDFVRTYQTARVWGKMNPLGSVLYACVPNGDIYTATILTGNTLKASASFTLPAMAEGARKRIANIGASTITVTANSGTTIAGAASLAILAGLEVEIELIGTDWKPTVLTQSPTPSAGKVATWGYGSNQGITTVVYGASAAGTCTYTGRGGTFNVVGNLCFIRLYAYWTGHTGSGDLLIGGLPFNSNADGAYQKMDVTFAGLTMPGIDVVAETVNGQMYMRLMSNVSGGSPSAVQLPSAGGVEITGFYVF
jgi:hypothetical protein